MTERRQQVPASTYRLQIHAGFPLQDAAEVAGYLSPVPGGVGPMTIACLLANTVTTASLIHGLTPPADLTP